MTQVGLISDTHHPSPFQPKHNTTSPPFYQSLIFICEMMIVIK